MSLSITKPVIVLVGPTAIGKTSLSIKIAQDFSCEVISVDSMQVYKYMDVGTAKITDDEMCGVPHHLIDIVTPDEEYDASQFAKDALANIGEIHGRGRIPLLTGGTGLYLRALLEGIFPDIPSDESLRNKLKERMEREGRVELHKELQRLDPESAARVHENDTHRLIRALEIFQLTGVPWSQHIKRHKAANPPVHFSNILQVGLTSPREILYQRINKRTQLMFELGLEQEVRGLLEKGYSKDLKSMKSIGYRHAIKYIEGEWPLEKTLETLARDTRHYAKRQFTWFLRNESIQWYDVSKPESILKAIGEWCV